MESSHRPSKPQAEQAVDYDVAIVGGSLSGAAAAILLLREMPELRVVIVEKLPVRPGDDSDNLLIYVSRCRMVIDGSLSPEPR